MDRQPAARAASRQLKAFFFGCVIGMIRDRGVGFRV